MSLTTCSDCRRQISTKAERCPHCGVKHPGAKLSDAPVPFLISATEVRRRKVKCWECGEDVALGAGSCPSCGVTHPADRAGRRMVPLVLALLVIGLGSAAAWKLGWLDRLAPQPKSLESGLRSVPARWRYEPPRTKSAQFGSTCRTPAPIYVYELGRIPSAFLVEMVPKIPDPARVADSLAKHYGLETPDYNAALNAFHLSEVGRGVVARLRCEPAVSSILESRRIKN